MQSHGVSARSVICRLACRSAKRSWYCSLRRDRSYSRCRAEVVRTSARSGSEWTTAFHSVMASDSLAHFCEDLRQRAMRIGIGGLDRPQPCARIGRPVEPVQLFFSDGKAGKATVLRGSGAQPSPAPPWPLCCGADRQRSLGCNARQRTGTRDVPLPRIHRSAPGKFM